MTPIANLPSIVFAAAFCAAHAGGIAIRHDQDEARHLEFGAGFPAVVQVGGLASGTLVAPDWVLTAAHAPEMLQRMRKGAPLTVAVGDKSYEVVRVVYPEQRKAQPDRHDLALLQLATPVPAARQPLPISGEKPAVDARVAIVGWGILAVGDEGIELSPKAMAAPTRKLRAGWNTIDRCDDDKALLFADFDAPADAIELEAGPCIGDSGGPVLVRVDGEGDAPPSWRIVGVIALIDDTDGDRVVGEYGEEFGMTAVHAYADWIRATIAE